MGPCPALARPNVGQILGADTHEQSSCCLTVPLPFRLVCGRLPDMVCSNDHLTAIRCRERAPSTTSKPVVGIVIAALVLLPEGLAALRAARAKQLQTNLNLALGSALASIGLTIPVVAGVSIEIRQPLELGLGTKDEVLLALTLLTGVITLGTGRTTVLQGIVHLVIFAVF